jgi:hypothetical protein
LLCICQTEEAHAFGWQSFQMFGFFSAAAFFVPLRNVLKLGSLGRRTQRRFFAPNTDEQV